MGKYYAVRKGRKPGIYYSWDETKVQVDHYPGAIFKSFDSLDKAEEFAFPDVEETAPVEDNNTVQAFVDGSYITGKRAGWGFVLVKNGVQICWGYGPTTEHCETRNIAAELDATKRAITKAYELGASRVDVYHDYEGIGRWADGDWQTKKLVSIEYRRWIQEMRKRITIVFHKVKGHSGIEHNETADGFAALGAKEKAPVYIYPDNADVPLTSEVPAKEISASSITWNTLGEFLKWWRTQESMTISAVSKKTGLTNYQRIEAGEDVKVSAKGLKNLYSLVSEEISKTDFLELWLAEGNQ